LGGVIFLWEKYLKEILYPGLILATSHGF